MGIHPPDVIPKYAPDAVIGMLGAGGGGDEDEDEDSDEDSDEEVAAGGGGGGGYTLEEVAKHTSKSDCWVVVNGEVLDVTKFLSEHPGGELAILTFAGKDASEEFNMIHPPDVIPKYAPDAIIGVVGAAKAKKVKAPKGGAAAPARQDKGGLIANHQAWGHLEGTENWRIQGQMENPGVFIINVKAYVFSAWYLVLAVLFEVCATIFANKNFKISNDRVGLTRSAILLILFIVIHAVGNLHVFMGPDDFNGYGYFYVRLYWTGFGLPANIVEEYILLAVLLHVFVALKRTWDISLAYSVGSGKLNLAITGIALLTFMTVHLFQFRFGETQMYKVCPPPYLVNLWTLLHLQLNLFWVNTPRCATSIVWSSRSSSRRAGVHSTCCPSAFSQRTWPWGGPRWSQRRPWGFRRAIRRRPPSLAMRSQPSSHSSTPASRSTPTSARWWTAPWPQSHRCHRWLAVWWAAGCACWADLIRPQRSLLSLMCTYLIGAQKTLLFT